MTLLIPSDIEQMSESTRSKVGKWGKPAIAAMTAEIHQIQE